MEEFEPIYVGGKKPKYECMIHLTMSKELKKKVQRIALEKDKTMSEITRELLEKYVAENIPKKRTIKSKKSV